MTAHLRSAAAREWAGAVLQRERAELPRGIVGVTRIDEPVRRYRRTDELVADEPRLHIEHAVDADPAERIARRPNEFVEHLRPRLGAGADQDIDDIAAGRAAVIGLTVVAGAAQI